MNDKCFQKIVNQRIEKTKQTLLAKADEYARGDRLSNFKKIAALTDSTPETACLGLVAKHIVALFDFTNDLEQGTLQSQERWDEKIGDIVAYMVLMDALVQEREKHDITK